MPFSPKQKTCTLNTPKTKQWQNALSNPSQKMTQ